MDLQSRIRWEEYTKAKEAMFMYGQTFRRLPWYVVEADDKRRARLSCIDHLLGLMPCQEVPRETVTLPERMSEPNYERSALPRELYVPEKILSWSILWYARRFGGSMRISCLQ